MRIYAVADIHGREASMERVMATCPIADPDVLVIAGDITGYGNDETIFQRFDNLSFPVLAIHGNVDHDNLTSVTKLYENIRSLHVREEVVTGVSFVGIGGGLSNPLIENLIHREVSIVKKAAELLNEKSVAVTHTPPWGILDRGFASLHGGSKSLLALIKEKQPRLLICGHIHEHRGKAQVGRTTVVNCSMGIRGAGALIEMYDGQEISVTFL
jgi:uncharacterized protein